jgi:hypothetical protein
VLPATQLLSSVIVSVPLRVPAAVGVKVTLMVQELLAATLLPQLSVWLKSPLVTMPLRTSGGLPVFLSRTGCEPLGVPSVSLPKDSVAGETPATGGVVAIPVKLTVCGLPLALS